MCFGLIVDGYQREEGAVAWKVTEKGELWEACVGIIGLVRKKDRKIILMVSIYSPFYD